MLIQVRSIANSWKDARTWTSLLGILALWVMARVIVPTPTGTALPGLWLPSCPLQSLAGIPCPFCGLTNGSAWFSRGYWREAWNCNILSPVLMISALMVAGYALIFRLLAGRAVELELTPALRRCLQLGAAILLAAAWITNLARR